MHIKRLDVIYSKQNITDTFVQHRSKRPACPDLRRAWSLGAGFPGCQAGLNARHQPRPRLARPSKNYKADSGQQRVNLPRNETSIGVKDCKQQGCDSCTMKDQKKGGLLDR